MKIYSPNFSDILVGDSLGLSLNGIDTASVITPTENRDFCSLAYLIDRKWKGDNFWVPDQTGGTQIGLTLFAVDTCWYRITNTYDNPSIGIFDFFISASITTESASKDAQFQIKIPIGIATIPNPPVNDDLIATTTLDDMNGIDSMKISLVDVSGITYIQFKIKSLVGNTSYSAGICGSIKINF